MTKTPLLVFSELGGCVYIVTKYSDRGEGQICADRKYDVTEAFEQIVRQRQAWMKRKDKKVSDQ